MRIFVLGVGATGSYLVKLLTRQGHHVTCGDRDPERARRFLGGKRPITVERVNARDPARRASQRIPHHPACRRPLSFQAFMSQL